MLLYFKAIACETFWQTEEKDNKTLAVSFNLFLLINEKISNYPKRDCFNANFRNPFYNMIRPFSSYWKNSVTISWY